MAFSAICSIIVMLLFIKFQKSQAEGFISSGSLLFDIDLYKYMLVNQFARYLTNAMLFLSIPGLLFIPMLPKKVRAIFVAFLAGAILYWVLVSKVIFLQNYYALIIVIGFLFCAALPLYAVIRMSGNKQLLLQSLMMLCLLVAINISPSQSYLYRKDNGYAQTIKYIRQHMSPDELFIPNYGTDALGIEANRGSMGRYIYLDTPEFKDRVAKKGLGNALHAYNVKYLITTIDKPEYDKFVNLFPDSIGTPVELEDIRESTILSQIDESYIFTNPDVTQEIKRNDIEKYFQLETQIGMFRIFKISE
jgi:hypothetical protein